jgi:hypothetical protein
LRKIHAISPDDDEALDELPPLDGDAGDSAGEDPDFSELVEDAGDAEGALLDDRTGEADPFELEELDVREEPTLTDELGDAQNLDLGDFGLAGLPGDETTEEKPDDVPAEEGAPLGGLEDDAAFRDDDDLRADAGEEGPLSEEDEVSEGNLPNLDADDQGSPEDTPPPALDDDTAGLPWAAEPWRTVGAGWSLVEATAIACAPKGAVAVGRFEGTVRLVHLDLEGDCHAAACSGLDPSRIRSLSADGDTIVAWTDAGLFVSADGGAVFAAADDRADIVHRPTRQARLLVDAPGATASAPMTVRGARIAYGARNGGVVRGGSGQPWTPVPWAGHATALVFLDDAGTLAVATYSEAEDTTAVVRVGAAGEPVLVAHVGPARAADADARVVAMAYDDTRGVLWVVGGLGVTAFVGR